MFEKFIIFTIILLAAIIQVTILPQLFPPLIVPNIALMIVVFWTIQTGFEKNLPRVILAGFLLDLIYQWTVGINIISLTIISFGISFLAKRFLVLQKARRGIMMIFLVIAGTLAHNFLIYIITFLSTMTVSSVSSLNNNFSLSKIVPLMFSNILLLALVYWPLKKLEKLLNLYNQRILNQNSAFGKR